MEADTSAGTVVNRRNAIRGFTLIEVLVVVAIIALLISILLPSLKRARDQAKAVVCAANLGQMGRAENLYQSMNREWIPGSPFTTGHWFLTSLAGSMWNVNLPGFNRFAVNMFDQITPLRALTLGGQAISRNRVDLIDSMTGKNPSSANYACPCNQQVASKYGTLLGPAQTRAVSYMTMTTIMCAGPSKYSEVRDNLAKYPGTGSTTGWVAQSDAWNIAVPSAYMPRHSRLGREQLKVFVADALRYYDDSTQAITYNSATNQQAKLMTCATPPCTGGAQPAFGYGREYNIGRLYSYRHGSNDRMQAVFFDGHVEGLSLGPDRTPVNFTGKAVHPQYYYPSGSIVKDASELHMDDLLASRPGGLTLP